jgi:hypothetical protein
VRIASRPLWLIWLGRELPRYLLGAACVAGLAASARFAIAPPRPRLAGLTPRPELAADSGAEGYAALFARLYRSGVRPISEIVRTNPLAQDYVDWGAPGPGRWVTIYSTAGPTAHAFIVIAGLRLDTSHNGTDVGPNRSEDGPRWRIYGQIPGWARWSVRHPPGL